MTALDSPVFKLEGVIHTRETEELEDFEGPLDLILYLLGKNKIEIQDIPIALILDQYLEYLDKRQQMDLEIASEFITMAAHLMYIKTRMLLSLEDEEPEEVLFFDHPSVILQTGARDTMIINGSKEHYERKLRILKFKSSIFINDFSSNQYHNYLLEKKLEIRGELGVVTLDGLKRVNAEGYPFFIPFLVHRDTSTWNSNMTISHITLGSDNIYTNPFYPLNLNDDEIGIATIIKNIEEGKEYRKIKDGIADAVLGKLL